MVEWALSVARATRNTVSCAGRCQFCLLAPEIIRYDAYFVIDRQISHSSDINCSIAEHIQVKYDGTMKERDYSAQYAEAKKISMAQQFFLLVTSSLL